MCSSSSTRRIVASVMARCEIVAGLLREPRTLSLLCSEGPGGGRFLVGCRGGRCGTSVTDQRDDEAVALVDLDDLDEIALGDVAEAGLLPLLADARLVGRGDRDGLTVRPADGDRARR